MSEDLESPGPSTPTRAAAVVFWLKASGLRLNRGLRNLFSQSRHYKATEIPPTIVAESRSLLWTSESQVERSLQLGKIENLRIAIRRLNGIRIKAGREFSFWKQLGRATKARGYVPGRELREGCLIPAIGGGLCQLSNAIYELALQSECTITERHAHSRVIPGSAAERGRDATVAWNYIDLRFIASQDLLLELSLSQSELIARFRSFDGLPGRRAARPANLPVFQSPSIDPIAHTCTDCGVEACFRHIAPTRAAISDRCAFLVDENWPEFKEYVTSVRRDGDTIGVPMNGKLFASRRYEWPTAGFEKVITANLAGLWRSLAMRRARSVPERIAAQISGTKKIAEVLAEQISFDVTKLVVAQSLLPILWKSGYLAARNFSVLMTRLPLSILHARLDEALRSHPEHTTLGEYRAPVELVEAEREALDSADRIITPHGEIATLFPIKANLLDWKLPPEKPRAGGTRIVFPGPTVARKGAYEVREVARKIDLELVLLGNELEGEDFWRGIRTNRGTDDWLRDAAVVVQPALVEDNPRPLLAAIASGVPVIASPSCGLPPSATVHLVRWGEAGELQKMLENVLGEVPVTGRQGSEDLELPS
jgi:hypothetical protein